MEQFPFGKSGGHGRFSQRHEESSTQLFNNLDYCGIRPSVAAKPCSEGELVISCSCDAMSRAIIKSEFASAAETAEVLGVSRANTQKLIQMAERALSSNRRSKAKNGARKIASRARKRS
jgi:hypothetical protein